MSECPSVATLSRIVADDHEGETYLTVERHVETCPDCRDHLERMRVNDRDRAGGELPHDQGHPDIPGFAILRELGRGGMGVVYLARHKNADRLVALKVVRSGPHAGSRERESWLREARAFSRVRHENVVTLFEFGEWEGWLYLVLDFIPGGTVAETLAVPYAAKDAVKLVLSVAEAVSAIHGAGLLHLDLKPANIFLDGPEGMSRELAKPRVGDLGIARRWNESGAEVATVTLGGPIGSPSHMAPEQITAERSTLGPRTDVYGLGAVLYHVLTGRAPFSAPSAVETLDQVRTIEPVSPRRLNPKIPRDLETICLKSLDKDPRRRYPTADALADDLHRWLDGRPILARQASSFEKGWRWCRRRPVIAGLSTMLILTIAISLPVFTVLWRRAEAERQRAEADFQAAADALFENIEGFSGGYGQRPPNPKKASGEGLPNAIIAQLGQTRDRILELGRRRPGNRIIEHHLQLVNARMALLYKELGDNQSARQLLTEASLSANKMMADIPDNLDSAMSKLGDLIELIEIDGKDGRREELFRHRTDLMVICDNIRTSSSLSKIINENKYDSYVFSIIVGYGVCSSLYEEYGEVDQARFALRKCLEFADNLPREAISSKTGIVRCVYRAHLFRLTEEASPGSSPTWDELTPLERLLTPKADELPPDQWAREITLALRREMKGSEAVPLLVERIIGRAALDRRTKRVEYAKKAGLRMLALGRLLVAEHPDDSRSHLILCEAYSEMSKNAVRTNDRTAVTSNLRLSLEAANRALQLNPNSEKARFAVDRTRTRLDKETKKPKSSVTTAP